MKLISEEWPYLLPEVRRSLILAYVMWAFLGIFGAHKFYLGRPVMGFLYFLTGGLLGLGWALDLLMLPWQLERFNHRWWQQRRPRWFDEAAEPFKRAARNEGVNVQAALMELLYAAKRNRGCLSVTAGVMATGLPFAAVQTALRQAHEAGYVDIRNHPNSGVVEYVFPELLDADEPAQG